MAVYIPRHGACNHHVQFISPDTGLSLAAYDCEPFPRWRFVQAAGDVAVQDKIHARSLCRYTNRFFMYAGYGRGSQSLTIRDPL